MFIGRVVGSIWSTVKWPETEGLKLLAVQPYQLADLRAADGEHLPSCSDLVICADVIDAGEGDEVVVAYGHAARVALEQVLGPGELPSHPVDAAVVAIVDHLSVDPQAVAEAATGSQQERGSNA